MSGMAVSVKAAQRAIVCWLVACCACVSLQPSATAQVVEAYYSHSIWTGDGEIIPNGVLLVRDGVIVDVGPRDKVDVPSSTILHELGAATLIPGLVVAQTNLVESTRAEEYTISPEVRAVDGFDPFDDFQSLLAAGITTVQISPGSSRLMPGRGAVVKLAGDTPTQQVLLEEESLRVVLTRDGLSPPTVYEPPVGAVSVERPVVPTKPQLGTSLAQAVVGLEALFAEAMEDASHSDRNLQTLSQMIRHQIVLRWTAGSNAEIRAALNLTKSCQLPWIIVDPVEIDLLVSKDIWESDFARGVILNPEMRPGRIANPAVPREGAKKELPVWERARLLVDAGAENRLALRAATDADLSTLLFTASLLGRGGLSPAQVLKTITANPARILGVADRVGILKANADADFVILSGEPFAPGTQLLATYSNGRQVYENKFQQPDATVIHAGKIYTTEGVLESSSIAVVAGKIVGLGADVSLPRGAKVRDFSNAVIVPGMIDLSANLGLGGNLSESIAFGTQLGPLLARDDDQVALGRQGGVTTALLSSSRLPSPVLAFKLTAAPRPLKDPVALRFEIDGNLTAAEASMERTLRTGKAYADAWKKYEADLAEYKQELAKYEIEKGNYDAAKAAAEKKAADAKKVEEEKNRSDDAKAKENTGGESRDVKSGDQPAEEKTDADKQQVARPSENKPQADQTNADASGSKAESKDEDQLVEPKKPSEPKKPNANPALEAYRDLFAQKTIAMVDVGDVKAVDLAVKLFRKTFGLKTAIVAGEAAAQRSELLAENEVFTVVGPTLVGSGDDGQLFNYPADLAISGVSIGFQSNASTGVSELPSVVSYAVFEGLGTSDALRGLTSGPARYFGLNEIGAIQVGYDADLVVLSGSPLLLSTEVLAVMIDGDWVYEKASK
ncbi:MAG: amidohydrolase family protein [Planctomycetales bacterium]|nr:amidohydrolase family protein [Planctomycetales bacterium]